MSRFTWQKPLLSLLFVLAAAVLFTGCEKKEAAKESGDAEIQKGDQALEAGEWNDAVARYTEAVGKNPKNASAFYGRSSARLARGKEMYILARAAAGEGEIAKARDAAEKADVEFNLAADDAAKMIEIAPERPEGYYILGCIAIYQADWTGAIEAFSETIELSPEMACAYQRRGEVFGHINDTENESADLRKAAELGYAPETDSEYEGGEFAEENLGNAQGEYGDLDEPRTAQAESSAVR